MFTIKNITTKGYELLFTFKLNDGKDLFVYQNVPKEESIYKYIKDSYNIAIKQMELKGYDSENIRQLLISAI